MALLKLANADRCAWPGVKSLLRRAKIKTERTLQKALGELVRGGWLRIVSQTWASLTKIQTAAGRRAPRRGDIGQATNLYIVLDGPLKNDAPEAQSRPGLARTSTRATRTDVSTETPLQISGGGPLQNDQGGPPANLHPDLDLEESLSKEEGEEREARSEQHTPRSSKVREEEDRRWFEAWKLLVAAHADRTKATFGLRPPKPDLKLEQREDMAECLIEAAAEVHAKILERTGIERDITDLQRDLAERVMKLYFARDVPYLRSVKYALRDLSRELHARMTEAMQALLRESNDAMSSRRVQLEQPPHEPPQLVETADNPTPQEPPQLVETADKPAVDKPTTTADKPIEVATPAPASVESQPAPAPVNNAREAQRILELLKAQEDPFEQLVPRKVEAPPRKPKAAPSEQPSKPALPEWFVEDLKRQREAIKARVPDKPAPSLQPSTPIPGPLGRSGAPRWGAIGPRPAKVRTVPRRLTDDPESEEHGGGSTPQT